MSRVSPYMVRFGPSRIPAAFPPDHTREQVTAYAVTMAKLEQCTVEVLRTDGRNETTVAVVAPDGTVTQTGSTP